MIYHVTDEQTWPVSDSLLAPASLETEGFVHCSYWQQLPAVVNTLFTGASGLIVLEIDEALLDAPVRDEDLYESGERYPHVYGPLPVVSLTGVLRIRWEETGAAFTRVDHLAGTTSPHSGRRRAPAQSLPQDSPDPGTLSCSVAPADDDAVNLLARLNEQLIADEGHDNRMDRPQLTGRMREFLKGSYRAYVFSSGPMTVGYALVDHDQSPPYLRQFFIQRGLRRGGLGRRGFELLLETAGIGDTRLEVLGDNDRAIRFWHSLGFRDRYLGLVRGGSDEIPSATVSGVTQSSASVDTLDLTLTVGDVTRQGSFIREGLKTYNDRVSAYHRAAREEGAITGVAVMLVDSGGSWRGGVVGECYWDWLEVKDLWIAEDIRGRGHGTRLLAEIERVGRNRGARHSHLHTFSFQAREFYERLGYRVIGELTDHPPGESLYWLRKEL